MDLLYCHDYKVLPTIIFFEYFSVPSSSWMRRKMNNATKNTENVQKNKIIIMLWKIHPNSYRNGDAMVNWKIPKYVPTMGSK